jgi:hypothetical protein
MNHSMHSADRRTHLKIIVVGLLCATVVAAVGIFANIHDVDLGTAPLVVKAGQPTAISGKLPAIR